MAVTAARKIGPYEVLEQIGAGGMGVVYRARDPRLNREVAIKVLPASFSADSDRLQRFAQEARAAAALNHPNILAIYDIGESEGAPYVVSELLEGENLRDRVRNGPLSIRKSIDFGLQMARGLSAAHDKGIVHRDLKPENLFVTNDGRLKILDFGLAKLIRPEDDSVSAEAPTVQVATDAGVVMGTVGYMSPEQVRGKIADHRSDLFAFGAILYEMLSGKRAFHGETPADTMSAILKDDPPELSETGRNVPPGLERVVNHCLEKSPTQRFQSAGDVAFNLESLTETSATSKGGLRPVTVTRKRQWSLPIVVGLVFLAACAGAYFLGSRGRTSAPTFHRLTFRRGTIMQARFAPDGQAIVYGAALEGKPVTLFTTRFDSTDSRPFDLEDTQLAAISRSGEMAVLLHARPFGAFLQSGTLARLPLAGGAAREVLDNVQGADWTPEGNDLAVIQGNIAGRPNHIEFPLGRVIYQPQGWVSHIRFSRDGKLIAFLDHVPTGDDGRLVVIDRDGHQRFSSPFFTTVQGVAWSPDNKEVWFTASPGGAARALYALDRSGRERIILRVPGTLTLHDVGAEGHTLLTQDNAQYGFMGLAPGEKTERNLSWFDWSVATDLSPDGKVAIFSETGEAVGARYGVYVRKTDGSPAVRLGDGGGGSLSPDGKSVAVTSNDSLAQIDLLPLGAGQPRRLTNDSLQHYRTQWLPDGSGLLFNGATATGPSRAYVYELKGRTHAVTPEGVSFSFAPVITPDSKYVLGVDQQAEMRLYPLQGGDPRPLPAPVQNGDVVLRVEADQSLLVQRSGMPASILRIEPGGKEKEVYRITPADPAGILELRGFHFSADEKSYIYSYYRVLSDLWVVDGLR
jgi:eukaryotic-like serine/threonine-protein kinase